MREPLRVLGIETSCDETAVAVTSEHRVLADLLFSQVSLHAEFGGVVPELASRSHLEKIRPLINETLERALVPLSSIDGIAVTCRPGLSGALLVGTQVAQALAWAIDKPLVGVDHLVGHLLSAFLSYEGVEAPPEMKFPFIGLLVSGGHTGLYRVSGPLPEDIVELGSTRDDAAGEAFDKVSKFLGLGYPGGPIVDRLASEGDPLRFPFPEPLPQKSLLEFSFSGLKTAVIRWVTEHGKPENNAELRDLCASFQRCIVDTLIKKALLASERETIPRIVLGGGVSANSELGSRGRAAAERAKVEWIVPCRRATSDNAAMIAYAGSFLLGAGRDDRGRLSISPKSILPRVTQKGSGPRAPGARESQ